MRPVRRPCRRRRSRRRRSRREDSSTPIFVTVPSELERFVGIELGGKRVVGDHRHGGEQHGDACSENGQLVSHQNLQCGNHFRRSPSPLSNLESVRRPAAPRAQVSVFAALSCLCGLPAWRSTGPGPGKASQPREVRRHPVNPRFCSTISAAILITACRQCLVQCGPRPTASGASTRPETPAAPAPRLHNGKPDLSGVWMPPCVPDMSRNGRGQLGHAEPPFSPTDTPQERQSRHAAGHWAELPFTPAGLADSADLRRGERRLHRQLSALRPQSVHQRAQSFSRSCRPIATSRCCFEVNNWFHVVPMGVDHPKDLEPIWYGHSVGKWDGDTLVIDTIGFNEVYAPRHRRPSAQRRTARDPDVHAYRRGAPRVHW